MADIKVVEEKNSVKVNPKDTNIIAVQEVANYVEVSASGPQGIAGPAGAAGAAGEQGEPGRFTVSETAPASPTAGDAWFRSSSAQLYLYYDGYWVETSTSYAGPAGATGATGATGSQGATGDQGESFSFRGAYGGSGIVYNLNDVVTYNGSSYICLSNNVSGSQPDSLVSWDIFVEKGATGATGASGTSGLETWTRYSPTFQATGLTFTGSGATYPTYNSYYVKAGQLVSFVIEVSLATVTNFGTGQYKLQLPFTPAVGFNHFSGWAWADPDIDPDIGTGHTILNCDTAGITNVLDLHYLKQSGGANSPIREGLFVQGTPVTLTTISKIYVNGTYIAAAV